MSVVFDLIARLAECETECLTFSAASRVIVLNIKLYSQLQNRSDLNMSSRRGETLAPTRSGNKRIAFCFKSTRRTDREQTSLAANDARGCFLLHFTAESNLLSDFPLIYSALNQKDVSLSLFSSRLFLFCRSDGAGGRTRGERRTVRATE